MSERDQRIIELYQSGLSQKKVANEVGVSQATAFETLKRYGIRRRYDTEFENKTINAYLSGQSADKIAKAEGVTKSKIYWILKKNNIQMRSNKENSRKYSFDDTFFEVIDNEDKAYWLGFLSADGYIVNRLKSPQLGVAISKSDKEHLELFKKAIKSEHPIRDYIATSGYKPGAEYSRFIITSEKLVQDAISKGIKPMKSLTIEYPSRDIVPEHLIHHFIRGYFDGNGSLTGEGSDIKIKICSTKEMLTGILNELGLKLKLFKRHYNEKNHFYITIGGANQVRKILNWLYKDATVYLKRKHEKALKVM